MLDTVLKIEDIVKINAYLSRLAEDPSFRCKKIKTHIPGEFRKQDVYWPKYPFDINEKIIYEFIINKIKELSKEYGLEKKYGENFLEILLNPNSEIDEILLFPTLEIQRYLSTQKVLHEVEKQILLKSNTSNSDNISKTSKDEINPDIAISWQFIANYIDLIDWARKRLHFFISSSKIKQELQKSIDSIKDSKMHIIEKTAKIWFDIIKIQPFNVATQRTAQAIGSAILLSHGYLPPNIELDDQKEYMQCIKNGFNDKNAHLYLTNFIAKKIVKVQQIFKDDPKDISEFSILEKKEK